VRLYEPLGNRAAVRVTVSAPVTLATSVDLLERHVQDLPVEGGAVELSLRPFQIHTLRFCLAAPDRV
jgi:alpha-mannosidase